MVQMAPLLVRHNETGLALDALSLIGKALYTKSAGEPYGLDGIVPLSVWYEGTLSYIAAKGPGSAVLFDNIKGYVNADGTVPHYSENLGAMAGIWAMDWSSLDGTAWLYFAASQSSPFDVVSGSV